MSSPLALLKALGVKKLEYLLQHRLDGEKSMQRAIEKLADKAPEAAGPYKLDDLMHTMRFGTRDRADWRVATLPPSSFAKLAAPLPPHGEAWSRAREDTVPIGEYLDELRGYALNEQHVGGLSSVPYLQMSPKDRLWSSQREYLGNLTRGADAMVTGHEGRHRNLALEPISPLSLLRVQPNKWSDVPLLRPDMRVRAQGSESPAAPRAKLYNLEDLGMEFYRRGGLV